MSIVGITLAPPLLSVRGVMPIRITVASGAFRRITSRIALVALTTFSTTPPSTPCRGAPPTLFVPPSRTMTLG